MDVVAAEVVENIVVYAGAPLRSALIVLGGMAMVLVSRFLLRRTIRRLSHAPIPVVEKEGRARLTLGTAAPSDRQAQRLATFEQIINSVLVVVVTIAVAIMVLSEFDVDVAPLLASAGVAGVALAFGVQSLVRDMVSGLFMLFENQYAVGDRVELGTAGGVMAAGVVEAVDLRITTLRDDDGRLWYVRNGEVLRVANESQGWSSAEVDVRIRADQDLDAARAELRLVLADVTAVDADTGALAEPPPTVHIVEISPQAITVRIRVSVSAGEEWQVASDVRRRIQGRFAAKAIALADA